MNARLLEPLDDPRTESGTRRLYGAVIGIVTNNRDEEGLGRVKVRFPWLSDANESFWARIAAPMAGPDRGICFLPEIDDEVVVMFEQGDMRFPFVLGALWNGKDKPPVTNDDGNNDVRVIKSRSGHLVRLIDRQGAEKIEIVDRSGGNRIVLDTQANTITIESAADIALSAPQGAIRLNAQTIEATASQGAKLAGQTTDVGASGGLKLHGKRVDIN